jgi:integrase
MSSIWRWHMCLTGALGWPSRSCTGSVSVRVNASLCSLQIFFRQRLLALKKRTTVVKVRTQTTLLKLKTVTGDTSMPDFLYDEVLRYIDALYDIDVHDRIFYFQKGTLGRALTEAANVAGVKRIHIHDLRHSHATLLVELGYSIVAVAERLGDTVDVAMSTYAHLYPNKMEQPILLISERLGHETVDTTWNTYTHLYPNKGVALADELQKMKF